MGYWEKRVAEVKKLKKVAREAIKYQGRAKLEILTDAVAQFRSEAKFTDAGYKSSKITSTLFELFNVTVDFDNGSAIGIPDVIYAGVMPPILDYNNPIVDEARRFFLQTHPSFDEYAKKLKKDSISGYIDFENAVLGDDISKLSSTLIISRGLMESEGFEDIEIAAIITHEIGHIFSYFASIISSAFNNMLARATAEEILATDDKKMKFEVVKNFSRVTKIPKENFETIIDSKNKELIYMHLYSSILLNRPNLTGSQSIAERNWERASDEFAARLGASKPLSTGLYKIHKATNIVFRESGMNSTEVHIAIEAAKLAMVVTSPFLGAGFVSLAVLCTCMEFFRSDIYDPIEERFKTMRNHLVGELRELEKVNGAKTEEIRQRILDDIASLDVILDNVKDKPTIVSALADFFIKSRKDNKASTEYHKQLEEFMNNDLIVSASKLKMRA